jgi:hypothetical protein
MAAIDRVIDYMSGMPQAAEHKATYATEFTQRLAVGPLAEIDGVEVEKGLICEGERQILDRLNLPTKFTRSGFDASANLGVGVSGGAGGRIRREVGKDLDFLGSVDWFLEPALSRAMYSAKESTIHLVDEAQKRKIMAKCPTLAGANSGEVYMTSIHERIGVPSDMRHMFTKMYLILQDYNLAVTSKSDGMAIESTLSINVVPNASVEQRLSAATQHDVVVDADNFTPQELGLLALSGESYPSVWYGKENMYTKCNMVADDLVIISDGDIDMDATFLWGSPDRLYSLMWSVAAKLNCVTSLVSALENMRGKCKLAADLFKHVENNTINSMIPLSYNLESSFGGDISTNVITRVPGYLSSSISLVADLLFGMTFEAVATCVVESLGGSGLLLSSKTPATSQIINGLYREYGLQHTSSEFNTMLQNWEIVAGRPLTWDFGVHLKEYAIGLGGMIANGVDIMIPQLLMAIPGMTAVNTAFGMARGWKGPNKLLSSTKDDRYSDSDAIASLSWIMGERETRPPVFYNRVGTKPLLMSFQEARLQAESDGSFGLFNLSMWLRDSVGGRVDEHENTATTLYKTEYSGTKCSLAFSYAEEKWVPLVRSDPHPRVSLRGKAPEDDSESIIPEERLEGINWGASPSSRSRDEILSHLKNLSRSNAIVPSMKARHMRVESDGATTVGRYIEDGEEKQELKVSRRLSAAAGDKVQFSKIDVPGDGQCGIHAVVEDLLVHGRINAVGAARAHEIFSRGVTSESFHDAQELAAVALEWGMNMDLLDVGSGRLMRYGVEPDAHTINIFREDGHFFTGVYGSGRQEAVLVGVEDQLIPNEEYVAAVRAYGNLFGKPSQ